MSSPLQYITNEQGQKIGVLLDLESYSQLVQSKNLDGEYLTGLSNAELQALATCQLALSEQATLDSLIRKNSAGCLSTDEKQELDELLEKADQLTILKTRARYTLRMMEKGTTAA
ncbi:MAG: hypothetical protein VKL20_05710 [Synechocystis sp.]|nr:hypothetical protein [Synechocystis sp.]